MEVITVKTSRRIQMIDITAEVESVVRKSGIQNGIVVVFIPHTTAAITVNENADPSVKHDLEEFSKELVPHNWRWTHGEGNSDSHFKSSMFGPSLTLIVENGRIALGTWQGIIFAEFDGPRTRKVWIQVIGA